MESSEQPTHDNLIISICMAVTAVLAVVLLLLR